jgi:hypothetical protein
MKDDSDEELIDPKKWGWKTWLVIDIAVGLVIAFFISVF